MTMKRGYMWMYHGEGVLGQSFLHGHQKVTPFFTSLLPPSSPPFLVFPLCTPSSFSNFCFYVYPSILFLLFFHSIYGVI